MYRKNVLKIATLLLVMISVGIYSTVAEQGNQSVPVVVGINYEIILDYISRENIYTSTGASLAWNNTGYRDNRVYYGLNETDVENHVDGYWSVWDNRTVVPVIRVTGLKASTTYYYRPQVWNYGTVTDLPVKSFTTLKPGVWTDPAEVKVSPAGWMASPSSLRTIKMTVAPLDDNGRYISGLLLQAVIYNSSNGEVGRVILSGDGPYYANYVAPDYLKQGAYYVVIPGYPNITGEFSVINRACSNCHSAGGANYPSTFGSAIVHSRHTITTDIYVADHYGVEIRSPDECDDCHDNSGPSWVPHPSSPSRPVPPGWCGNCHKSSELTCKECHNDKTTNENIFSQRYGTDAHKEQACENCHNGLGSINGKPTCTTCHPREGSGLETIPDSIGNRTHSSEDTVACGLCHNSIHDVKSLSIDSCRNCHPNIDHDRGRQCTTCHGNDIHEIISAGDDCITCHGTDYPGADSMAESTFVNISSFNESIHQNINDRVNKDYRVSNEDCWQCHFNKDMERTNIKRCNDCHRNVPQWHGDANITTDLGELSMNQY